MSISRVLVANRGEIALRVLEAAADLGLSAVAVQGDGPADYLDVDALVAAATGFDAVHPGYGFLSEDAGFARACLAAGLVWVGPSPEFLELFGDKAAARTHAVAIGVPVPVGTGAVDLAGARAFVAGVDGPVMIKAVHGGGGRGMRAVAPGDDLAEAFARCSSEAGGAVLVEELRTGARHVEVQLIGDGERVLALGDRDCSVQRRHQKILEIAPATDVPAALPDAAVRLAAGLRGVATAEFLVDDAGFVFVEVNPRIQVEHTVTEVGPDAERTATVRHVSRMFVAGANARVPLVCVVLRKAYGLGAMAMAGGGMTEPVITVAWPSGEFGGMGLEGAVRLGYRAELDALPADEREDRYRELVAGLYERGKALSTATVMEIDDVIDPADTRQVITAALGAATIGPSSGFVDTW